MPELPEVESARQVIERGALDRRIVEVDDHDTYECRPHAPGEIAEALLDRRLRAVHRRGKLMWCETTGRRSRQGDGPLLGLHLGMSGRIVVVDPDDGQTEGGDDQGTAAGQARTEEWYRFTLTFDDGGRLRLLDKRRLGRVRLDPDLGSLGPDAGEIGREEFRDRVGRGTAPLKAHLLDQSVLAGVGNLLADEVLWQAGLDPRRPARELSTEELDDLRRRLRSSIRRAIRLGGVHTGEVVPHRGRGGHCPRCVSCVSTPPRSAPARHAVDPSKIPVPNKSDIGDAMMDSGPQQRTGARRLGQAQQRRPDHTHLEGR